jgi:hypothetical protein
MLAAMDNFSRAKGLIECVQINYRSLLRFDKEFLAALSLLGQTTLEMAKNGAEKRLGWTSIAHNHAALSVWHFGKSLHTVRAYAGLASAACGQPAETNLMRAAWKRYCTEFPHVDNVRHAIAHAGELNSTPEKMATHTVSRGATFGYIVGDGQLVGSAKLRIGFQGKWFELDVGMTTATTLEQIISQVDQALPPLLKGGDAPP